MILITRILATARFNKF